MKKKTLSVLTVLATPLAAANHGGSTSLTDIAGIVNALGLTRGNMVHNLGLAATFGLIWLSVYMIMKKVVVKLGVEELFNLESSGVQDNDKKNLLAVLALLMVLSILGTGHAMGFVWDIQMMLVGALFFGVIALLIAVVGGGAASAAWTAGKTGKALETGIQEAREAGSRLRDIGGGNVQDDPDQTEAEIESIVQEIDDSDDHIEGAMGNAAKDLSDEIEHINDAINGVQNTSREYENVNNRIKYLTAGVNHIRGKLIKLKNNSASGTSPNLDLLHPDMVLGGGGLMENTDLGTMDLPSRYQKFGLIDAKEELETIIDSIERIEKKEEHVTSNLDDELNKLIAEAETVTKSLKGINLLMQDIDQVEDYEQRIEQYAQELDDEGLFNRARRMEEHEEALENSLEQLKNRKGNLKKQLQDLKSVLKQELQISKSEKAEIESRLGDIQNHSNTGDFQDYLSDIRDVIDDLNTNTGCSNSEFPDGDVNDLVDSHIPNKLTDLRDDLRALHNANNHEIDDDQDLIAAIDEAIAGLENWDDSF